MFAKIYGGSVKTGNPNVFHKLFNKKVQFDSESQMLRYSTNNQIVLKKYQCFAGTPK